MKKIIFIALSGILFSFHSFAVFSQIREVTLLKNDSLFMELNGYREGSITWQRSTNLTSWDNLGSSNNKTSLRYKMTDPYYIRAQVVEDECNPYYADTLQVNLKQAYTSTKLNGGRGYAEPYVEGQTGLSMNQNGTLSNWTDTERKAVWYIYQMRGIYNMGFALSLTSNTTRHFTLVCTRTDNVGFEPVSVDFSYTGRGASLRDSVQVLSNINIAETGYYRYELTSKDNGGFFSIYELLFSGFASPGETLPATSPHATDYLSSPSVHLRFSTTASTVKQYDWFYQEIMVPSAYSPTTTYWMSIGFDGGYFGMQANSNAERRILFSVWDQIDADYYKKIGRPLPTDSLVTLVDKAPYVTSNAFGNEGTGGQSYVGAKRADTWLEDQPVKFLVNVQKQTVKKTTGTGDKPTIIISAWYKAYENEGWRYIATWRRPYVNNYFDGFYSFIENFGASNGQLPRKGYYYNAFGREAASGQWKHFNKVAFSNTDGSTGQRIDFEQGVSDDDPTKFYMFSGGYGKTKKTAQEVPLIPVTLVDTMNLTPFLARIEEALVVEYENNSREFFDKNGWEVIAYSSQETSGEGSNGRASMIIDGDPATYWHSQWTGGNTAQLPHWFVIDMKSAKTIKGFQFVSSDGSRRWMKNIRIETSNNNSTWTTAFEGDAPESISFSLKLDAPAQNVRYFKLTIINGFSDPPFTRLNEIDVY